MVLRISLFDENLARQTYGDKWTIAEQLQTVGGFDYNRAKEIEWYSIQRARSEGGGLYHGRTGPAALKLWYTLGHDAYHKYGIRGLIYKGNRDGHCALPYDFSSIIPFAVSKNGGKSFIKMFNREGFDYLVDHPDVDFRFGGKFHAIHGSVMGFSIVENSEGKFNILNTVDGNLISDYWFDSVQGQIDPRNGSFIFSAGGYDFLGSIKTPEGESETGCILDPYRQPYCPFSSLEELIEYMHDKGARNFKHLMEIEANEDEEPESEGIFAEALRRVLYENRIVDSHGVVTVDNFDNIKQHMSPDSDDDVWFIKIVQRHKDNPHLPKNGRSCDHYVTYYLLHNADELSEKENEIKEICKKHNARAYINLNKRSLVKLTDYANNVLKPRFIKHNAKEYIGHEIEVAAGQAKDKDFPERKLCFLDIDTDDTRVYDKVMKMLADAGIEPLWEYRSLNNGWHIVLPDKEQARGLDFSTIDRGFNYGRFSTVGVEIDKPILLYASLRPNGYGVQQRVQRQKRRKIRRN